MLPENADRYTVKSQVPVGSLRDILEACGILGLSWFIVPSEFAPSLCDVYIFFDKQGMKNYMNGLYTNETA